MRLTALEIQSGVEVDATKLVRMLASLPLAGNGPQFEHQLAIMAMQCQELLQDAPDYEAAARTEGWKTADMTHGLLVKPILGEPMADMAVTWKQACDMDKLVVPAVPVQHVYVVTPRLGCMLELCEERINKEMFGWYMWADFRDEQQHKYLLHYLANVYDKSEEWFNSVNAALERHLAATAG